MTELSSLASPEGRHFYRSLYRILRYERQYRLWETLRLLWQIAIRGRSLSPYWHEEITVRHPLGFWAGTRLLLEEIIARYHYATILSFVYGGAALLLVVVGLRRFSSGISDTVVMVSIGLEALLLLLLFTVMFFSPSEEASDPVVSQLEEIVREIGEIGREHATSVLMLDKAITSLEQLAANTASLANTAMTAAETAAQAVSPAPELLEQIAAVNRALAELKAGIEALTTATHTIKREMIETTVRRELEQLLVSRLHDNRNPSAQQ